MNSTMIDEKKTAKLLAEELNNAMIKSLGPHPREFHLYAQAIKRSAQAIKRSAGKWVVVAYDATDQWEETFELRHVPAVVAHFAAGGTIRMSLHNVLGLD